MPSESELEAAARALCAHVGHDPDMMMPVGNGTENPMWMVWKEPVKSALEAAEVARSTIIRVDGEVPKPRLVHAANSRIPLTCSDFNSIKMEPCDHCDCRALELYPRLVVAQ